MYRRSDGTQTTKRGFSSERAAQDARRRLIEQVERGEVRHTTQTFGQYWERWLEQRRQYFEAGTWAGYEIAGRTRLLPAFGARSLGELSVDDVREFVTALAEDVESPIRTDGILPDRAASYTHARDGELTSDIIWLQQPMPQRRSRSRWASTGLPTSQSHQDSDLRRAVGELRELGRRQGRFHRSGSVRGPQCPQRPRRCHEPVSTRPP